MRLFARIYFLVVLFLLPVVLITSWLVGAYNNDVRSLLDSDGVRWGVTHILSNYRRLPLSSIILLLVTSSIVHESGWLDWAFPKKHPLTLKQLRAYTYTNMLILILFAILISVLLMPASPLLNSFGELDHSPLAQGWFPMLLLSMILVSNVYGYLTGRLTTAQDFTFAHTRFLRKYAPAFITLFIVAQIDGCIVYSHLLEFSYLAEKCIMLVLVALCFVGHK